MEEGSGEQGPMTCREDIETFEKCPVSMCVRIMSIMRRLIKQMAANTLNKKLKSRGQKEENNRRRFTEEDLMWHNIFSHMDTFFFFFTESPTQ